MKVIKAIGTLLYKVYFGFVFLLTGSLLYPYFFIALRGEKKYDRAKKIKKIWSRLLCILAFIKIDVKNKELFPEKGPYIVCANHTSYLDIILMYFIIPEDFAFLGKAEVLKWPLISIFFKRGVDIPVFRNNRKKATESLLQANNALKNGRSLAIFPEGGIMENPPTMGPFKNGAFTLSIDNNTPIIPVTFVNNYKLFSDHTEVFKRGRPGKSIVKIHSPIYIDNTTNLITLRNMTYDVIKKGLQDED